MCHMIPVVAFSGMISLFIRILYKVKIGLKLTKHEEVALFRNIFSKNTIRNIFSKTTILPDLGMCTLSYFVETKPQTSIKCQFRNIPISAVTTTLAMFYIVSLSCAAEESFAR